VSGKPGPYVSDYAPYGCIKSKTTGWIGWMLLYDVDKSGGLTYLTKKIDFSKFIFLISMNHFSRDSALTDVFDQYNNQFKPNLLSRHFKRFFIKNRFWFHEDMEKLRDNFRNNGVQLNWPHMEHGYFNINDIDDYRNRMLNSDYEKYFGKQKNK
jgi:hypothetical protein